MLRRIWRAIPLALSSSSSPAPMDRRRVRDWASRYWSYPTFLLSLTAVVRASSWAIGQSGVRAWLVTAAVVFPAAAALSFWYFRRSGDLPGEPWARRRLEEDADRGLAHQMATFGERRTRKGSVMRGTFRWASPTEESRSLGLGEGVRFFATARAAKGEPASSTRIVVDGIVRGEMESQVEARWVLPDYVEVTASPGADLVLRDGRRVVAHLRVEEIASLSTARSTAEPAS